MPVLKGALTPTRVPFRRLRAVIYCRVSDPSATDKFGMEAQESACRAYAERLGFEVVAVFKDWQTGTELFERKEMSKLREAMKRREFDVLILDRLDRLSRKAIHQGYVRTEAEYYGIALHAAIQDLSNPLMVTIQGGIDEQNRDSLVANMARGKRTKVDAGKPLGGTKPPFGLRWRGTLVRKPDGTVTSDKTGWEEDPERIGHLRRMFHEYDAGLSLRKLAAGLERDGIAPAGEGRSKSGRWHLTTLTRILSNPVYVGEAYQFRTQWGRERREGGSSARVGRHRPQEEWVRLPDGVAPVVIDRALFDRVQRRLAGNQEALSCRPDRDPHVGILRRGYVFCAACGQRMTVVTPKRQAPYYRCDGKTNRTGCDAAPTMTVETLDEEIWAWLREEMRDEKRVRFNLAALDADDGAEADLATIDRQLSGIARQQRNLTAAVARLGDDDEDAIGPLVLQLKELGKQHREVEDERAREAARQQARVEAAAHRRTLRDQCRWVAAQMSDVTDWAGRRALIEMLAVRVDVYPEAHGSRWAATSAVTVATREDDGNALLASATRQPSSVVTPRARRAPSPVPTAGSSTS